MGSASTDVRGSFGGVEGRRLQKGDVLRTGKSTNYNRDGCRQMLQRYCRGLGLFA